MYNHWTLIESSFWLVGRRNKLNHKHLQTRLSVATFVKGLCIGKISLYLVVWRWFIVIFRVCIKHKLVKRNCFASFNGLLIGWFVIFNDATNKTASWLIHEFYTTKLSIHKFQITSTIMVQRFIFTSWIKNVQFAWKNCTV